MTTKKNWFPNDDGDIPGKIAALDAARENLFCAFPWETVPNGGAYWYDVWNTLGHMRQKLQAYQTRPKTKTVERWHVEFWGHSIGTACEPKVSREVAEDRAQIMREDGFQCVRVTGPHQHEVPA